MLRFFSDLCLEWIFRHVIPACSFIGFEYIDFFLWVPQEFFHSVCIIKLHFFPSENSLILSFLLFLKLMRVFCNFHFYHLYKIKLWICLSLLLLMIWRHSKIASESARKSYGFLWRWYKKRHFYFLMLSANLTQPDHLANKWGNLGHCYWLLDLLRLLFHLLWNAWICNVSSEESEYFYTSAFFSFITVAKKSFRQSTKQTYE